MVYTPHEVIKDANVLRLGLGVFQDTMDLGALVHRETIDRYKGKMDDTLTYRVEGILPAREYGFRNDRSQPLQLDTLRESKVDVTLSGDAYSAVEVTDEQREFDLVTGAYVMRKQAEAVAQHLNHRVAEEIVGAPYQFTVGGFDQNPRAAMVRALRMANDMNLPQTDRYFIIGSAVQEMLALDPNFTMASVVGDDIASQAFRTATIGVFRGANVVVSSTVPSDFAAFFHGKGLIMATAAHDIVPSAPFCTTVSENGYSLRWIRDYDTMYVRDRSVVQTWYGTRHVEDFLGKYDYDNRIMTQSQERHFVRGIKLAAGPSEAPAAGSDLAKFSGFDDSNLYTPPTD